MRTTAEVLLMVSTCIGCASNPLERWAHHQDEKSIVLRPLSSTSVVGKEWVDDRPGNRLLTASDPSDPVDDKLEYDNTSKFLGDFSLLTSGASATASRDTRVSLQISGLRHVEVKEDSPLVLSSSVLAKMVRNGQESATFVVVSDEWRADHLALDEAIASSLRLEASSATWTTRATSDRFEVRATRGDGIVLCVKLGKVHVVLDPTVLTARSPGYSTNDPITLEQVDIRKPETIENPTDEWRMKTADPEATAWPEVHPSVWFQCGEGPGSAVYARFDDSKEQGYVHWEFRRFSVHLVP